MSRYTPDKWVILKFKSKEETWYKVLGSWYGGYLNGDSWRMSSGLVKIEEEGDFYLMCNHSGSTYKCHKKTDGMHMTAAGIYMSAQEQGKENDIEVSIITVDQFNKEQVKDENVQQTKDSPKKAAKRIKSRPRKRPTKRKSKVSNVARRKRKT